MQLEIPVSREQLEELIKVLSKDDIALLGRLHQDAHFAGLVERYRQQVPDLMTTFVKMSEDGYLEDEVVISDKLTMRLRTLSSWMYDESQERSYKTGRQMELCARDHARRCFAYALCDLRGKVPSGAARMPETSYFEVDASGQKMLVERATKVEEYLSKLPESLYNLLQLHRAAWDTAVMEHVKSCDVGEAVKK